MEKKNNSLIRIALIGPESTSKSTLSEALAKHYKTVWVEEYSREYLNKLNRAYTLLDIETIAKEQLARENKLALTANRFMFIDTELIIAKVWCEDVFQTCPEWIKNNIQKHPYDFYLLTFPDIAWEADPLRENPIRRMYFFDLYETELKKINAHYAIIKGIGESRIQLAISEIEKKFPRQQKNT